ncbi:heme-binding protein [Sinimarinibacterium sp. NLF-5-8]|uniref:heme-binding protein n=1 Tax=Sinimarinibacterium sp. NLF-5-8 TaxID=2698684 RepID=UPI00137BA458|nr:heme-binding protein [Sinimarinibacterium sp. NLF-5-8]QHS11206.1 hypothetical protein GT972_14340 [Sinimarinibacterium sp. NLF-5-8]
MSRHSNNRRKAWAVGVLAWGSALVAGCSGGDAALSASGADPTTQCSGRCADAGVALTTADVQRVLAQAVAEARARGVAGTIAVTDRVGNVLAVYRMTGATTSVRVGSPTPVDGGLEGISLVPSAAAAIAKAVTGAYLSSEGNAFSTRTASQIVQAHFNPDETGQMGGPLSGVQFSQLPCSDLMQRATPGGTSPGPQRSPLGLSADPGGFPLYKNGTVVGGVGVEIDGIYGLDPSLLDRDAAVDEQVALAASFGFAAPLDRRADRITVEGKLLRFSDVEVTELAADPSAAPAFGALPAGTGALIAVTGYTDDPPQLRAGTAFAQPGSGIRPAVGAPFASRDAFWLVDAANANRYPPQADASAGAASLTQAEVEALLLNALDVANAARAQIRRPVGSAAAVTISVVGFDGRVLGVVRTRDAPIFGTDVSLQKARTALLFSRNDAGALLTSLPPAGYLQPDVNAPAELRRVAMGDYVTAMRALLGDAAALADGTAYGARTVGNFARPFFPDGVVNGGAGPLAKPQGQWSPFSTGLQLDLGYNAVVRHVAFVAGLGVPDVPQACAGVAPLNDGLADNPVPPLAANGIQIFAGGVPIYRGNQLIGGIGVSGDGIEQDDMIAFLGLARAGAAVGGIGNAPIAQRADQLSINGLHPRYVQCPQAPFNGSNEENVCAGQ